MGLCFFQNNMLNRRAFSDLIPENVHGSRRKEEARQSEFLRIGQVGVHVMTNIISICTNRHPYYGGPYFFNKKDNLSTINMMNLLLKTYDYLRTYGFLRPIFGGPITL